MMKKFFEKSSEREQLILELDKELIPEVYDYLNTIVKLDENGNIISYNQVFESQFGYNERDLKDNFFDVVLKNNSSEIRKYLEKALSGETQKFDDIGFHKNGNQVDIQIALIPTKKKGSKHVYAILKNTTNLQQQEKKLNQFQKMREAFDKVDYICCFYYDAVNDLHYFSKQITEMLRINPVKKFTPSLNHILRYVHTEDKELVRTTVLKALDERVGFQIEYRLIRADQTICLVREQSGILLDKKGRLEGFVGFIQDITDHKMSDELLEKEKNISILYDNPDIGIWSIDFQNSATISISKGIEYISGYTQGEFNNGLQWVSIVHSEDLQHYMDNQVTLEKGNILQHQYRIIAKNGDIKWVQDYTIPTFDHHGNIIRLNGITSDITERKVLEEQIKYLANYDVLTNLPKRNKLIEKLEQLIKEYTNSKQQFAVIKLDIDGFKYVNDTVGNDVGDELLKRFTSRITNYLSANDVLARRGGDEFIILLDKIDSISSLKMRVNSIFECLNEPFNINDYQLYITASLGISVYPENGVTSLELLRNANLALLNAKKRGKNNYYILSQSSSIQSFKNYSIGRDLKKAVENEEMVLYFQPQVDSRSNQIIGAEALIRWNHSEWGLISPHEFLIIAEENGLITEIDNWVIHEVCQQIKTWKNRGIQVIPISINISAIHFLKPDWPSQVARIIRDAGIQPNEIEFEVTETTILSNSEMVKNSIFNLKELGIKITLDDFGKGYSSLSYLTEYPFDVIKIDKTFIRNMHQSDRDLHLIKSIIYMAKGLQLRVVAEGVETIRQLKTLQQQQCHEIQGYLFSHPVPSDEFETLLRKKTLQPIDPEQKALESKRKHYRLNFPYPLEADIKLISIAGRNVELGVSKVLVEDISIGGLRFVSNLKLPIRGDVIYQFETELLNTTVILKGNIIWKEEINEDLVEYGIQFILNEDEQAALSNLLNSFIILLTNQSFLPPYRKVSVERSQYFK